MFTNPNKSGQSEREERYENNIIGQSEAEESHTQGFTIVYTLIILFSGLWNNFPGSF